MPAIKCPRCQAPTQFDSSNAYRPFCSKRCKLIDLGSWANEDYKIASTLTDESEDSMEQPPSVQ